MLLEDDNDLRETMTQSLLDHYSIDLIAVKSANAGIEILKEDRNFSMIISDINMPDGTGFDLLNFLRDNGFNTPLIFFSTAMTDKKKTNYAGFLGSVDKFEVEKLLEIMAPYILTNK